MFLIKFGNGLLFGGMAFWVGSVVWILSFGHANEPMSGVTTWMLNLGFFGPLGLGMLCLLAGIIQIGMRSKGCSCRPKHL